MRVAIGAIVRTLGGPATYARELVRELVARAPTDLEYVVLTDGPEAFHGIDVIARHLPLASPYAQVFWDHARIPIALRQVQADLYHGTKNVVPAVAPCPSVVTVHDLAVYHHPESFAALQRWHLRLHTPHAVHRARAILTVSEHAATDLRHRFPGAAAKVRAVPNGVAGRFTRVDDPATLEAFRHRHGLGSGPLVGYLGTLQPRKNVELLAAAFAGIAVSMPEAQLVLAGRIRPGYTPELSHPRIRLIGPVAESELPLFYSAMSVLVSVSLYEGFGLTLLEAMACGCPVVALRRSAVPEVVGDAALLLDQPSLEPLTAMLDRLLRDPELQNDLRARGYARSAAFSWARAAAAVEATYRAALARSPM